jgi:hypothetical protein
MGGRRGFALFRLAIGDLTLLLIIAGLWIRTRWTAIIGRLEFSYEELRSH